MAINNSETMAEIPQSLDDLLAEKGKACIQDSLNILQPIIRNFFIQSGYTFAEDGGGQAEEVISDQYLRLHFNMIQLARYHNLRSLLLCMTSIGKVHDQFRYWLERSGGIVGGGEGEKVLNIYDKECIKVYSYCLEIPTLNLLSNLVIENEINNIRRALTTIIEAFENLQRMRTKYITLNYHDHESDTAVAYLRELYVDWKELRKAREQLPHYGMLESKKCEIVDYNQNTISIQQMKDKNQNLVETK
ncbi:uncharacterized protein [Apostichopus japonicus]|uniref:uncharacterized protein isoform X2 n=1 Tax=Stichopus japonicus TaxID=307972 RepID=UPI003AB2CC9D